ncbi:MAG: hypothetical protein GYA23_06620 [Methanomicrobiales archaeon]|nr:hypothetical protein [Methanomicrobiales archaeon]
MPERDPGGRRLWKPAIPGHPQDRQALAVIVHGIAGHDDLSYRFRRAEQQKKSRPFRVQGVRRA